MNRRANHRVKMVIELEFDYRDEMSFNQDDRLATKSEIIKELKDDFENEGLSQFAKDCQYSQEAKVKSVSFIKFDKGL